MNGTKFLVDTNICIYLLNDDKVIAELLNNSQIYISFITEIELYAYHSNNPLAKQVLDSFIKAVHIVSLDEKIKQKTIEIRRNYKFKLPDSIIAASAFTDDCIFVTADKAFKRLTDLDFVLYVPAAN
jgi:predicted nucleic acid-binding protein